MPQNGVRLFTPPAEKGTYCYPGGDDVSDGDDTMITPEDDDDDDDMHDSNIVMTEFITAAREDPHGYREYIDEVCHAADENATITGNELIIITCLEIQGVEAWRKIFFARALEANNIAFVRVLIFRQLIELQPSDWQNVFKPYDNEAYAVEYTDLQLSHGDNRSDMAVEYLVRRGIPLHMEYVEQALSRGGMINTCAFMALAYYKVPVDERIIRAAVTRKCSDDHRVMVLETLLCIDKAGGIPDVYCAADGYFPVPVDIYVNAIEREYLTATKKNNVWRFPCVEVLRNFDVPVCALARSRALALPDDYVMKRNHFWDLVLES